jgi:hypothetical protein
VTVIRRRHGLVKKKACGTVNRAQQTCWNGIGQADRAGKRHFLLSVILLNVVDVVRAPALRSPFTVLPRLAPAIPDCRLPTPDFMKRARNYAMGQPLALVWVTGLPDGTHLAFQSITSRIESVVSPADSSTMIEAAP